MKWTDFEDFADYMAFTKEQKKVWRQLPEVKEHQAEYLRKWKEDQRYKRAEYLESLLNETAMFGPFWKRNWFTKYQHFTKRELREYNRELEPPEKREKRNAMKARKAEIEAEKPIEIRGVSYKDMTPEQRTIHQRFSHRNSPRDWKKKHPKEAKLSSDKSRAKRIEKARAGDREYAARRRKEDIEYRLVKALRNRLVAIVKAKRTKASQELVGCTIVKLREHLESQFIGCMSWENYGKAWHIDHIVPLCYFDLSIKKEQLDCFNFNNLRPLWAKRNLRRKRGMPIQQNLMLI